MIQTEYRLLRKLQKLVVTGNKLRFLVKLLKKVIFPDFEKNDEIP